MEENIKTTKQCKWCNTIIKLKKILIAFTPLIVEVDCLVDTSLGTVLYREKAKMKSFIFGWLFCGLRIFSFLVLFAAFSVLLFISEVGSFDENSESKKSITVPTATSPINSAQTIITAIAPLSSSTLTSGQNASESLLLFSIMA